MFDHDADAPNVTSWLVYNPSAPKPEPQLLQDFYPWEDTDLVPVAPLPPVHYDTLVNITVNFTNINGINFATINDISYQAPDCPAMFTALTTGPECTNPAVYGNVSNTFILPHLHMIWLVINNGDEGGHPCTIPINLISTVLNFFVVHLHGHSFQVLYRSKDNAGFFQLDNIPEFPMNPMRRDVLLIPPGGYAILAFRADNPGAWFLYDPISSPPHSPFPEVLRLHRCSSHCHIDWHVVAGMVAQFIEAPHAMQRRLVVPSQVSDLCIENGIRINGPAF